MPMALIKSMYDLFLNRHQVLLTFNLIDCTQRTIRGVEMVRVNLTLS